MIDIFKWKVDQVVHRFIEYRAVKYVHQELVSETSKWAYTMANVYVC